MNAGTDVELQPQAGAQAPVDGDDAPDQADELLAANPHLESPEDEQDEPGDEDDVDDQPQPPNEEDEPEGRAPSTEALLELRGKQLDRLGTHVRKKLTEIFGAEEADTLDPCPLCSWTHTYGYVVPGVPPDFVREATKVAIGFGTVDELESFAAFAECATCKGLGNVRTGSHVTAHLYRECPTCKGIGYSSSLPEDAAPAPVASVVTATVGPSLSAVEVAPGAPPQEPDFDSFGTPRSHPDFGKMPQFRVLPISHWQDNLPAESA